MPQQKKKNSKPIQVLPIMKTLKNIEDRLNSIEQDIKEIKRETIIQDTMDIDSTFVKLNL